MSYTRTRSQLNTIFAGPSAAGFITPAKFKKLTTPPAFRVFRAYMRPHCPFRHYLRLRHNPYFDKYLKLHRRKRHPVLTNPPIDLPRFIYQLKNIRNTNQRTEPVTENRLCPLTLKMQNKPKLKTAQIPVTPLTRSTKKNAFQTPQQKNKAKQTQTTLSAAKSGFRRITPAVMSFPRKRESSIIKASAAGRIRIFDICDLIFNMIIKPKRTQIDTKCHSKRSRGIYLNSYPPSGGFRIFDICAFIFDMFFMTNKPNFRNCKTTVSPFLSNTYDHSPAADDHKNKPKQTQLTNISTPSALEPP